MATNEPTMNPDGSVSPAGPANGGASNPPQEGPNLPAQQGPTLPPQEGPTQAPAAGANPSVVDYLGSIGHASDFGSRASLANQAGIQNYTGSADQNTQLLGWAQTNLKAGGSAGSSAPAQTNATVTPPVTNPNTPLPASQLNNAMTGTPPAALVATVANTPTTQQYAQNYATYSYKSISGAADSYSTQAKQIKQEQDEANSAATDELNGTPVGFDPQAQLYSQQQTQQEIDTYNNNAKLLNSINAQVVSAQEALSAGLAFDDQGQGIAVAKSGQAEDLQKQSIAQITALTALASQIQNNISAVKGIIDSGVSAAAANEKRIIDATGIIEDMATKGLTSLNDSETSTNNNLRDNAQRRAADLNDNGNNLAWNITHTSPNIIAAAGITATDTDVQQEDKIEKAMVKLGITNRFSGSPNGPSGIIDQYGNIDGINVASPTPGVGNVILAGNLSSVVGKGKPLPTGALSSIYQSGAVISKDKALDPVVQTGALTIQYIAGILAKGGNLNDSLGKYENDPKMKSLPGLFGINKLGTNTTKDFTDSTGGITQLAMNTKGQTLGSYLGQVFNAMALSTMSTSATQFAQTFQSQLYSNQANAADASTGKGSSPQDGTDLTSFVAANPSVAQVVQGYLGANPKAYADALAIAKSALVANNPSFSADDLDWQGQPEGWDSGGSYRPSI